MKILRSSSLILAVGLSTSVFAGDRQAPAPSAPAGKSAAKAETAAPAKKAKKKYIRVQRTGSLVAERIEVPDDASVNNTQSIGAQAMQRMGKGDVGSVLGSHTPAPPSR
jgi:hypothetical protein